MNLARAIASLITTVMMTMTKAGKKSRGAVVATLSLAACADSDPAASQTPPPPGSLFAAAPDAQWRLPHRLREISGIAAAPDGRLFAHDDERAVLYELDAAAGALRKSFALGAPVLTADFEGLAISPDGAFWMTTSDGLVYRFTEGADDSAVAFERFETRLGQVCEIEGLAYLAAEQSLILACKRHHARDMRDTVALYIWSPGRQAALWRSLPERDIAAAAGVRSFRPSSVEIDPRSGRVLLLSANDSALAELNSDGTLAGARALPGHPQPEGVTLLADGTLIISDEGGDGRALLSRYPRVP